MMGYLMLILVVAAMGGGFVAYGKGEDAGRAAVQAEVNAAQAKLDKLKEDLRQEVVNHEADIVTAMEVGESSAKTRTVYVQTKGAQDVQRYPVFQNPVCVLPEESLRNVNAARAGFRRDPPPDSVRVNTGNSQGPGTGPAADPGAVSPAVRGAGAPPQGNTGGDVHTDASGRRPMGKVRAGP